MGQFILIFVILQLAWLCESIECLAVYTIVIFVVANFAKWMGGKGN